MNQTYLLIGGNIGDRFKNLENAVKLVGSKAGRIVQQSALYETAAWGMQEQPAFLNQVLLVETDLGPEALLDTILAVEKEMGRERQEKYGPRTIDIDILLFNDLIMETERLTVPHPQMHLRKFVLAPLADLAAAAIHPVFKKSVDELLMECPDKLPVKKL